MSRGLLKKSLSCFLTLCVWLSLFENGRAQTTYSDSIEVFRPCQLFLPATLFTVGAFGVENGWLVGIRHDVKDGFQAWRGDNRCHIDDYAQYLPLTAHVGLGLVGVESRHSFKDRAAATATACLTMAILVNGFKYTIGEPRPDSGARNSFPSGHTATAFVGAELVREEYGNGYGAAAYLVASGIAFFRMYNNRH